MARVDDRRAASQFHREEGRVNERPEPQREFRERAQQATERQDTQDERQRKIDEVVQRMKQQRERGPRPIEAAVRAHARSDDWRAHSG